MRELIELGVAALVGGAVGAVVIVYGLGWIFRGGRP